MKSLYIFADSERPDQYINSIVHCVLDLDVRSIHLIHIRGFGDSRGPDAGSDGVSARLLAAILSQLTELAERGEYTFLDGIRKGQRILLCEEYGEERAGQIQDLYKKALSRPQLSYSNSDIAYDQLRLRIGRIAKEGASAYVDVSSIRKKYMGDIVAAGLVEGLKQLNTFDISSKPDYDRPWTMLVHDLGSAGMRDSGRLFSYTNILDTPVYRECSRVVVVRAPRLSFFAFSTLALIFAASIGYWLMGPNDRFVQAAIAVSGIVASILSLVLVFVSPRKSL